MNTPTKEYGDQGRYLHIPTTKRISIEQHVVNQFHKYRTLFMRLLVKRYPSIWTATKREKT